MARQLTLTEMDPDMIRQLASMIQENSIATVLREIANYASIEQSNAWHAAGQSESEAYAAMQERYASAYWDVAETCDQLADLAEEFEV